MSSILRLLRDTTRLRPCAGCPPLPCLCGSLAPSIRSNEVCGRGVSSLSGLCCCPCRVFAPACTVHTVQLEKVLSHVPHSHSLESVQTRCRPMLFLLLTLFPRRDVVWFGTMGTAARQRAVCLVDVSGSLHKWLDDDHGRAGGGCGRGLMLRDRSRAAACWMCSAELILQRGAEQPAQLNAIGT